ncbi:hypothetical protein [Sphingobacterium sp. MYb388]|uniref:hypothetical protein n=1 Tax=Sphingobacterium sp. MYb388 TaxID=2745437 RepID=UPI0030A05A66
MTNKSLLILSSYLYVIVLIFINCALSFSQTVKISGRSEISEGKLMISFLTKNGSYLDSTFIRSGVFEKIIPKSINEKYNIKYDKDNKSYEFYCSEPITDLYLTSDISGSHVKNPSDAQLDNIRYNESLLEIRRDITSTIQQLSHLQGTKTDTDSLIYLTYKIDSLENLRITTALSYYKEYPFSLTALESLEILLKKKYGRDRYEEFKPLFSSDNEILKDNAIYKAIKQFIVVLDDYHAQKSIKNYTGPDVNSDTINLFFWLKVKLC